MDAPFAESFTSPTYFDTRKYPSKLYDPDTRSRAYQTGRNPLVAQLLCMPTYSFFPPPNIPPI